MDGELGYVEDADSTTLIPSDDALKRAIQKYGAVASTVNTRLPKKSPPQGAITWDDYTGGVFPGIPSSSYEPLEIDHDVLMVGWKNTDNSGNGYWIIRNSWGEGWGGDNKGFIYLPYRCNNIGCTAAWALPWRASALNPALITKFGLPPKSELR